MKRVTNEDRPEGDQRARSGERQNDPDRHRAREAVPGEVSNPLHQFGHGAGPIPARPRRLAADADPPDHPGGEQERQRIEEQGRSLGALREELDPRTEGHPGSGEPCEHQPRQRERPVRGHQDHRPGVDELTAGDQVRDARVPRRGPQQGHRLHDERERVDRRQGPEEGHHGVRPEPHRVGGDHQAPAVEPIHQHAGERTEHDGRKEPRQHHAGDGEPGAVTADPRHHRCHSHEPHPVAERGDQHRPPQPREVGQPEKIREGCGAGACQDVGVFGRVHLLQPTGARTCSSFIPSAAARGPGRAARRRALPRHPRDLAPGP